MYRKDKIIKLYNILYKYFGPQNWWPGDTIDEIIIGAILTQNTSWKNVEKAINNLKKADILSLYKIYYGDKEKIIEAIKPSGFYNQKYNTLKNISTLFFRNYKHSYENILRNDISSIKKNILSVKGIGNETCDSILLYAFKKPTFVVDTYTVRILLRHNLIDIKDKYNDVKKLFSDSLESNIELYNEYHALLVRIGKEYCLKKDPLCNKCPIKKGGL
ncbi:endonuclease [candidate division TA06 bacterium]|uniref:Endonuclease n=1 Tax=candidate division TA06 bacterium TaxID=2250710 RepID=A0A660SPJ6_UNCT6|nr:MAG: endonuclease [candidate division TA06 bacterium]